MTTFDAWFIGATLLIPFGWVLFHAVGELSFWWRFRDCRGPIPHTALPPLKPGAIVVDGQTRPEVYRMPDLVDLDALD